MDAIFKCARMILHNQCPPDRRAYLCMHGEEYEDSVCIQCWDNYLMYVANRRNDHPYQFDLNTQKKQESRKV